MVGSAVSYEEFLKSKTHSINEFGIDFDDVSDMLFDFQKHMVKWALKVGRAALFQDCGLGKTIQQLEWARIINKHESKPILIITPLAVSSQTVKEGEKFKIECTRSRDGSIYPLTITNYERLHYFNPESFAGVVLDESSILKSFNGAYRKSITKFMRKIKYRLLATATAAPNDYIELGSSSEVLGALGYVDMLNRFFKNDQNNTSVRRHYGEAPKWRFKGHAEIPFWRWVSSWARAIRKPSDMGFDDGDFTLPPLNVKNHMIDVDTMPDGMLFNLPALNLFEQRKETRRTLAERCEHAANLVNDTNESAILWCHLNDEGDLLKDLIPDAVQVSGSDKDDDKEAKLTAFANNEERVLITKPKIGAWGLNLQHCAHVVYFPSHSHEQYYQAVRRCWRFGQKRPVRVDIVLTEGQKRVMQNLERKSEQADRMFDSLIAEMHNVVELKKESPFTKKEEVPSWL
jgi:SNF2 family DNA or RNA helicase